MFFRAPTTVSTAVVVRTTRPRGRREFLLPQPQPSTTTEGRVEMEKIDRVIKWLQHRCGGHHDGGTWRLRPYINNYLLRCLQQGCPIDIVTIWCLSRGLEKRWLASPRLFNPIRGEIKAASEITVIIDFLQNEGLAVNWFIFPATSAVTTGQINPDIATAYCAMLNNLIADTPNVIIEPMPHISPVAKAISFVSESAMERERLRRKRLYEKRGIITSNSNIEADLQQSIGVKAAEGLWLVENFPDGLLVPVEYPERYVFHDLLISDSSSHIMNRVCPILTPYPWRDEE